LRQAVAGDVQPYLLLTLGLAGAVLLIACSNLANLLLARALARRKEVTIRAALGAGRRRIALLFLAESWTVAIAGGLAGLALAHWWVGLLKEAFVPDFPSWMAVEIDARALLFSLAVTAIAGTLAGLAPAIAASRVNLSGALNEGSRGSSEGAAQAKLRSALVVIQVALAAALLALSGLLVKSVWRLQDADPGFRKSGMLTFRTDPPWARYSTVSQTAPFYRQALEALGALPGVEAAAANHSLPLALNQNYGKPVIEAEGQTLDEVERNPFVNVQIVSPNYFRAMEIPIRLGRAFDEGDRLSSPRVAVLSRPVAERLFGAANPIGARIRVKGLLGSLSEGQQAWFTVIGVSEAVRSEHIAAPPGMDIYFSNQQQFAGDTFFILRTARPPGEVEREAARAIRGIDPAQPIFDFRPLEERVNGTIWQRRLAGRLSSLFGALAILLAGLGIYAVLAYGVLQRTREMGIRLALGSTPGQLRRLIVRQGLSLVAPGSVLGLASAALASGHLAPLLHGVSPFDPAAYSAALALVLSMGVLACWLPALRASRTDPGTALRQD
jgi:predicted permease